MQALEASVAEASLPLLQGAAGLLESLAVDADSRAAAVIIGAAAALPSLQRLAIYDSLTKFDAPGKAELHHDLASLRQQRPGLRTELRTGGLLQDELSCVALVAFDDQVRLDYLF